MPGWRSPNLSHVLRQKALVYGAVAFPQDKPGHSFNPSASVFTARFLR